MSSGEDKIRSKVIYIINIIIINDNNELTNIFVYRLKRSKQNMQEHKRIKQQRHIWVF